MKRLVVTASVVGLVLATAACSVDVPSPDKYVDQAKSVAASAAADEAQAGAGGGAGDPSDPICADAGTPGMKSLGIGLQLLAQPSLDNVLAQRAGEAALLIDIEGINAGIQDYRVLDGHAAPGFKDPKEPLDLWQDLSDRMAAMIDGASDPTQADIDAYTAAMGEQQALIMSQVDVAVARDQYCQD